jgi:hypothetical protein
LSLWTDMTNHTATPNHSNRSTDTDPATGSVIRQKAPDSVFGRRNVRKMGYEPTSTTADASQRPRLNRSRWAAIGAAVAVSLGAGGFGLANATISEGEMPVYIAIDPCRLTDTRPQFLVGPRATPYGPNETVTWVGTGAQGNCNVPAGVSALALNVTALDATAPTYLQFAPGNTVTPGGASSLNPVPGEPPTPNAVTISIDDEGEFSIYNLAGTVNVIIDVVGYFDDHMHTGDDIVDGSLTGADVEDESLTGADIDNGSVTRADILDESGLSYVQELDSQVIAAGVNDYASVKINAPASGYVTVDVAAQMTFSNAANPDNLICGIDTNIDSIGEAFLVWTNTDTGSSNEAINLHRTFPVDQGSGTYYLNCLFFGGAGTIDNISMTATYESTWRGDLILLPPIVTFPIITLAEPAEAEPVSEAITAATESMETVTATTLPAED